MKRPSPFRRESRSFDASMTPMIDVVFLLLIFFLWTSSFQIAELLLPSELTAAATMGSSDTDQPPPPEMDFDEVVVRLVGREAEVSWRLNDEPLSGPEETLARLRAIANVVRTTPIVIHPDADVELGIVIEAYDVARQAGFDEIQYAVQDEESTL